VLYTDVLRKGVLKAKEFLTQDEGSSVQHMLDSSVHVEL
jgi:hypothetical protein